MSDSVRSVAVKLSRSYRSRGYAVSSRFAYAAALCAGRIDPRNVSALAAVGALVKVGK